MTRTGGPGRRRWLAALLPLLLLAGCATTPTEPVRPPVQVRDEIARRMPNALPDRAAWAADIEASFAAQGIEPTPENICAVLAVTAQESGFVANPEVAGLGSHCHADTLPALTGKKASQEVIDKAVRDAGARTARVVKPGMAVTMDYREDRITISVDADNRIERASCG